MNIHGYDDSRSVVLILGGQPKTVQAPVEQVHMLINEGILVPAGRENWTGLLRFQPAAAVSPEYVMMLLGVQL